MHTLIQKNLLPVIIDALLGVNVIGFVYLIQRR
jgi:hypothetical protein